MKDLQLAVRGSAAELRAKPSTVFSCCPTSPIKWSDVTSQHGIDCGAWGIPRRIHLDAALRLRGPCLRVATENVDVTMGLKQMSSPSSFRTNQDCATWCGICL